MKRILSHYRFGKPFAWINRNCRSRRQSIKKVIELYQSTELEENGCMLCKEKTFSLIAEGDRYGFPLKKQLCNTCGLIQTYPRLSKDFHTEFYTHHYRPLYLKSTKVDYNNLMNEQKNKGLLYLRIFQENGINKEQLKKLSIIEIGCSSGGTINTIRPSVKNVQGCDLDIHAIEYAKNELQLNVEVGTLPTIVPEGKKLFIISHVLEHVYDPIGTLQKIRKMMCEGDYLFIAVPGINGVAEGDYKNDLRRYFHIAHVTDFTAHTLEAAATKTGFKTVFIDEAIHALLTASQQDILEKKPLDPAKNLRRIEKTYSGIFPHL